MTVPQTLGHGTWTITKGPYWSRLTSPAWKWWWRSSRCCHASPSALPSSGHSPTPSKTTSSTCSVGLWRSILKKRSNYVVCSAVINETVFYLWKICGEWGDDIAIQFLSLTHRSRGSLHPTDQHNTWVAAERPAVPSGTGRHCLGLVPPRRLRLHCRLHQHFH